MFKEYISDGNRNFINPNDIILSTHLPPFFRKYLQDNLKFYSDNDYLVCPKYLDYKGDDIQIGITGKIKRGEDYSDGVQREILEETGLLIGISYMKYRNKKDNYLFCVCDKWKAPDNEDIHYTRVAQEDDESDIHCGVGIIVRENEIDNFEKILQECYEKNSTRFMINDNIKSIVLLPISYVNNIL
jgi:hypothetical protein